MKKYKIKQIKIIFFLCLLLLVFTNCGNKGDSITSSLGYTESNQDSQPSISNASKISVKDKKVFYRAVKLFDDEDWDNANKLLTDFINKYQENINTSRVYTYTYFMLGMIYEKRILNDEFDLKDFSIDNYQRYLDLNQHQKYRARAYEGIARVKFIIYDKKKSTDDKKQDLLNYIQKSIDEDTNRATIYRLWGNVSIYFDDYSNAEKKFKKAIRLNPNSEWNYIGLGTSYSYLDDIKNALKNYEKALKINSVNKVALENKRKLLE